MKDPLALRWPHLIILCSLATPALALGTGGLLDSQTSAVTRQVEQSAERLVERAIDRRAEEQINVGTEAVRDQLESLPSLLPINTDQGEKAFNEVVQDDGTRAVQRQWLVIVTADEIAELEQPGITILQSHEMEGLGLNLVRFRVAPELDSRDALRSLLPDLSGRLDRNHIYAPQNEVSESGASIQPPQWRSLCEDPVRIGMVDTSIATEHPVFGNARVVQERFLTMTTVNGELPEPTNHGTAVASLLVGAKEWPARLPGATLFNASVFYDRDRTTSGATLGHLLEGLNWLASQGVSVINISLTGPDNRVLSGVIKRLRIRNITLVAAVGNQGPAAAPLYPAAYPGVIGVTAVDRSGQLYRWANRGEQVMFSALGVSVPVAEPEGDLVTDSGTSLAAPVITAALACRLTTLDGEGAIQSLIDEARDLGEKGRDPMFGHGFLDY